MDEWEGINWSAIAQAAFTRTIQMEEARRVHDEDAALAVDLQRLRGEVDDDNESEAMYVGQMWARRRLSARNIKGVIALNYRKAHGKCPDAKGWGAELYCAIEGTTMDNWDRTSMEMMMEEIFGDDCRGYPTAAQVRGFVAGVRQIYERV